MSHDDPPDWNGIPELENLIMPLAMEQTQATLGYGRLSGSSEPHRCEVCQKLLKGTRQIAMGLCGAHLEEAF